MTYETSNGDRSQEKCTFPLDIIIISMLLMIANYRERVTDENSSFEKHVRTITSRGKINSCFDGGLIK